MLGVILGRDNYAMAPEGLGQEVTVRSLSLSETEPSASTLPIEDQAQNARKPRLFLQPWLHSSFPDKPNVSLASRLPPFLHSLRVLFSVQLCSRPSSGKLGTLKNGLSSQANSQC